MSAKELVIVVSRANRVVGARPRSEMRAKRLPHRATYVLVFNSAGELYVQKRTLTKDIYPGFCDPATGGVVLAGENYEQAARRELAEELGIRDISLERHQDFYFEDPLCCVWGRIFSGTYDRPMILQTEEVQSGEFLPVTVSWSAPKRSPLRRTAWRPSSSIFKPGVDRHGTYHRLSHQDRSPARPCRERSDIASMTVVRGLCQPVQLKSNSGGALSLFT